jgi:tetratricopeptide (TPR) repeat protein
MEIRKSLLLLFLFAGFGLGNAPLYGQAPTAQIMTKRGNLLMEDGRLEEAIQLFSEALASDPRCPVAYVNRGIARQRKGDLDRAIADYGRVARLKPRMAQAHYKRGSLLMKKGDLNAARAAFARAIEIDAKMALAYAYRGLIHLRMTLDGEADKDFKRCLSLQPSLKPGLDTEIKKVLERRAEEASRKSPPVVPYVAVN